MTNRSLTQSEGYDLDRFLNHAMAETLQCSICLGVLRDARQCEKQHLFCAECISEALSSQAKPSCPVCRCPVAGTADDLSPAHRVIDCMISELLIRCLFYERGCDTVRKLSEISDHERRCPYRHCPVVRDPYPSAHDDIKNGEHDSKEDPLSSREELQQTHPTRAFEMKEVSAVIPTVLEDEHRNNRSRPHNLAEHQETFSALQPAAKSEKRRRVRRRARKRNQFEVVIPHLTSHQEFGDHVIFSAVEGHFYFEQKQEEDVPFFADLEYKAFNEREKLPMLLFAVWQLTQAWFPMLASAWFRQVFMSIVILLEVQSLFDRGEVLWQANPANGYTLLVPIWRRVIQKAIVNVFILASLLTSSNTILVYLAGVLTLILALWAKLCTDDPNRWETSVLVLWKKWDVFQICALSCAALYNLRIVTPGLDGALFMLYIIQMFERMPVRQERGETQQQAGHQSFLRVEKLDLL